MDQESVISNAESEGRRSSESWQPGLDPEDERALEQAREDGGAIVEEIPTEDDSLGWFSVICLLLNRMIGETRLLRSVNLPIRCDLRSQRVRRLQQ